MYDDDDIYCALYKFIYRENKCVYVCVYDGYYVTTKTSFELLYFCRARYIRARIYLRAMWFYADYEVAFCVCAFSYIYKYMRIVCVVCVYVQKPERKQKNYILTTLYICAVYIRCVCVCLYNFINVSFYI